MILQVDLYDGDIFRYILVFRRIFATDEGNVVFLECRNALQDLTAESGTLLKRTCKLRDLVSANPGSILTPYQTIFLMTDSDAIMR